MPDSRARPTDRTLICRAAALVMWGTGRGTTGPARAAFASRFEKLADPEGNLPPEVRARRAGQLRRAHFVALARRSVAARRAKARGEAA